MVPAAGRCGGGAGGAGARRVLLDAWRAPDFPAVAAQADRANVAYGGAYEDARLQAKLANVVERLVAASDRPDTAYHVTILNSPAINAFALPNGQLYVTRGLIGLANDSSELASVLSHEMAHVVARHAGVIIKPKTLASILDQAGLTADQLRELL